MDALAHELSLGFSVTESEDPAFITGRRGDIRVGGRTAGVFGEIHPAVLNRFDLEQPVAAFELDLSYFVYYFFDKQPAMYSEKLVELLGPARIRDGKSLMIPSHPSAISLRASGASLMVHT
jgi:hypothetical protein